MGAEKVEIPTFPHPPAPPCVPRKVAEFARETRQLTRLSRTRIAGPSLSTPGLPSPGPLHAEVTDRDLRPLVRFPGLAPTFLSIFFGIRDLWAAESVRKSG